MESTGLKSVGGERRFDWGSFLARGMKLCGG